MKYITNQASFKAGRLSKTLYGRTDTKDYSEGLSIGKNGTVAKSGGAYKRFGVDILRQLPSFYNDCKIVTYMVHSDYIVHIVLAKYGWIAFNSKGKLIGQAEWVNPSGYENTDLFDTALYENEVFITHYSGDFPIVSIKFDDQRDLYIDDSGEGIFAIMVDLRDSESFYRFPMNDFNTDPNLQVRVENTSFDPGTNGGQITLRANFNMFSFNMLNDRVMIRMLKNDIDATSGAVISTITSNTYQIKSIISTTEVRAEPIWVMNYGSNGVSDILQSLVVSPTGSGPINGDLAQVNPAPPPPYRTNYTQDWAFEAFRDEEEGWPKTVSADEGRLIYGGTKNRPNTFFGSAIGDPYFFMDKRWQAKKPAVYFGDSVETDPYQFTIASDNDSDITFMQGASSFVMGTSNREYIVSGTGATISKKNVTVRPNTAHGSKPILSAVYDTNVFYVGTSGTQLFMLKYSEENGSFMSKEMSIVFEDILDEDGVSIKDIQWSEVFGALFIVLTNGKLLSITINNETGTFATMEMDLPEGVTVVSTSGAKSVYRDVQSFIYEIDGVFYVGEMSKNPSKVTGENPTDTNPSQVISQNIHKKIKHGDLITESLTDSAFEQTVLPYQPLNMYICDTRNIITGDPVIFQSFDNLGNVGGIPEISYGTIYYAIVTEEGFGRYLGIRLATSQGNALSNTFITFSSPTPPVFKEIYLQKEPIQRVIPVKALPDGATIQLIKIQNVGDEAEYTEFVKAPGQETYDTGTTNLYVAYGISYEFHIATMPIEAGQQWGSSQLGIKRPDKVSVRYYKTYSFLIGTDGYNEEEVIVDDYSTGRKEIAITANSEYDSIIHIRNTKMEPCYIINMTIRGLSNDG